MKPLQSMSANFNRQFVLLDFRLLEDPAFLRFISSSEFGTYLVLRRYVWRGEEEHYMGLHNLYWKDNKLASSLTREKIAEITGIAPDNLSRHLSSMVRKGIIQRQRTGRQNIYVLGEWIDVKGDGSHKVEWYFMEGVFGVSKADLTHSSDQNHRSTTSQTPPSASDTNREVNTEENTVRRNGNLKTLPDLKQPEGKAEFVAEEILEELGDKHSESFYRLVARKVPEPVIQQALAEIRVDGAMSPARVFTHRMMKFASTKA